MRYRGNQGNPGEPYEFCTRCDANLTLQKGYSNSLPYWICKGCGEMLINPSVSDDSNIAWICDGCEAMLNIQPGFGTDCGVWTCTECGYKNRIDESEIYETDELYRQELSSPYRGLGSDEMKRLSSYFDDEPLNDKGTIFLVRDSRDGGRYVKKLLSVYDKDVIFSLREHPVENMPKITDIYESDNCLIVIEEYIEGRTLSEILADGVIEPARAAQIACEIAIILRKLHSFNPPIIHRDIKPSNVIIGKDEKVYLIDINAAKLFKPGEIEDTRLLGTQYYAAPEQLGFGFSASSEKTDIYALGVLLNVMITGRLPKEAKAPEAIWHIVEKCICYNPDDRYNDSEVIDALSAIEAKS